MEIIEDTIAAVTARAIFLNASQIPMLFLCRSKFVKQNRENVWLQKLAQARNLRQLAVLSYNPG